MIILTSQEMMQKDMCRHVNRGEKQKKYAKSTGTNSELIDWKIPKISHETNIKVNKYSTNIEKIPQSFKKIMEWKSYQISASLSLRLKILSHVTYYAFLAFIPVSKNFGSKAIKLSHH